MSTLLRRHSPTPTRTAVRLAALAALTLLAAAATPAARSGTPPLRGPESIEPIAPQIPITAAPIAEQFVPSFINVGANVVEFHDRTAIARLAARWAHPGDVPVVIAHFGDSHVQKGYLPEAVRLALQQREGSGGRGMVFPYAIAKTYSQNDFDSTFTGTWKTGNSIQQPPRLPVGVSGFDAMTTDPSVSVALAFKRPLDPGGKRIRVFYRAVGEPYRLTLRSGPAAPTRVVPATADGDTGVAEFDIDQASDTIELDIDQTLPGAGTFELHGISILNAGASGLVYHNLGVGGAVFDAVNEQAWFAPELRDIHPDLVILDYGTNDIVFKNAVAPDFESQVRLAISRVRAVAPRAAILLTSTQDMTFRGHDITATAELSAVLRRIAGDTGCLYWDWYRISGGAGTMPEWRADELAGKDGIHLTRAGYQLKGRLLATALEQALDYAAAHPYANALAAPGMPVNDPIGDLLRGPVGQTP